MASIYASSFLTIAATRSANLDGGLYTTDAYRSAHTNDCIELPYGIYIRNKKGQVIDGEPAQVALPPLTRAWVLQEHSLSPRVVHFGTNGLSWECNTICTSENVFNELCYMGTSINRIYDRRAKSPLHQWHVIVSEYTKLKLSFERDIFPALQGIARYIAKQRECRYVAGLWGDTLLYDLFWVYSGFESGTVTSVETDTYRAPTWSWASRIGHVKWWTIREAYHKGGVSARVVHVETTPIGDDPMGEVQGGRLEISGQCTTTRRLVLTTCTPGEWCADDGYSNHDSQCQDEELLLMVIFREWSYDVSPTLCLAFALVDADKKIYVREGAVRITKDSPAGLLESIDAGTMKTITVI